MRSTECPSSFIQGLFVMTEKMSRYAESLSEEAKHKSRYVETDCGQLGWNCVRRQ